MQIGAGWKSMAEGRVWGGGGSIGRGWSAVSSSREEGY